MFIPPPLAVFATCVQYLSYLMLGHCQTLSIIASSKQPYENCFGKWLTCGFNCILSIISHRREILASTPAACSMIENTIHDTLERFPVSKQFWVSHRRSGLELNWRPQCRSRTGKPPEQASNSLPVVNWPRHTPGVFWPGWNRTMIPFHSSSHFACNSVSDFWLYRDMISM